MIFVGYTRFFNAVGIETNKVKVKNGELTNSSELRRDLTNDSEHIDAKHLYTCSINNGDTSNELMYMYIYTYTYI